MKLGFLGVEIGKGRLGAGKEVAAFGSWGEWVGEAILR